MTAIFSDQAIAMFLHPALNSVANIAQRRARLHHLNAFPHRFIGSLYQPAGQRGDIAYQVHLTGVGNHARFLEVISTLTIIPERRCSVAFWHTTSLMEVFNT